jgi:pimeloyl-ACP methyl ester carboxylesterase
VLERSEDAGNPVVLFLHGGPGTSQLTSNRRDTRGLEKYFTVVNWDQRGARKSYCAIRDPDRMNISQFVDDTRELTVYLLEKFHQDRLVLVWHSWGTVIGALAVSGYPELYSCYIGDRPDRQDGGRRGSVLSVDSGSGQETWQSTSCRCARRMGSPRTRVTGRRRR